MIMTKPRTVRVSDNIQRDYTYTCTAPIGQEFDPVFTPDLTPQQMLELGVFGGNYLNDCQAEFPAEWFSKARLSDHGHDPSLNFFKVDASQSLQVWQKKGWIYPEDPRGWFQWYARYYMGRRIPSEDQRQIQRWRAMTRHIAQLKNSCQPGDWSCRTRQRQALLHWAYDSRVL